MCEWSEISLGELADIRFSNVDKKSLNGEIPVRLCNYMDVYANDYVTADLNFMEATASAAEIERFRVECGDVIITKDSETPDDIGISAVVLDDVPNLVCGYHLALIKPKRQLIDPVFLSKQLGSDFAAEYFARRANGSTRYGLSASAISRIGIPVAPLGEQRPIAEALMILDRVIASTESVIAKYQQIKVGLMHDLFTRGVDAHGRLRPAREEAPELYKPSPLGWLPKDWDWSGLRQKGHPTRQYLKTGPFGSSLKGEHWVETGRPVITIGSLGEGEFIESELLFVSPATAKRLIEFQLEVGDVVFSRVADVGRSVAVREEHSGWIMSSNFMRISLDRSQVIPEFLQQQLSFDSRLRAQIRSSVNSGGRDVANSAIMNGLQFAWPPYPEQELIMSVVAVIDARSTAEKARLEKLRLEKSGLMSDLLSGRVRVPV